MSSHHIVKDQQEPALIVHRIEEFPHDVLGQLLEWSPIVIVCGPALEAYLELGLKLDIAIIPFDVHVRYLDMLKEQEPVKVISLSEPNYLMTALQLLQKEGHSAVNIITQSTLKDEVIESLIGYERIFSMVCLDEKQKHSLISRTDFSKWFPAASEVVVTPLNAPGMIKITGTDEDSEVVFEEERKLQIKKEGQLSISSTVLPYIVSEPI